MRTGRITDDSVPGLIRTRAELDKPLFRPRELVIVEVASCGVVFGAFLILVGVVVSTECELVESARMERVLLARGGYVSVPSFS